ncbi:Tetratricopeptide (TPR) repeat [Candidatus Methanophagaceae archaeon]|jgi:tetratricopeptide (TPR) repeat protein|nr:Tetratricopeptide (TPR) repeat [Methanophagales archaeon]
MNNKNKRPYKSLLSYDTEDKDIFFGRDDDIKILSSMISTSRLTLLYAQSGVGKTSLLKAGVIPELEDRGYTPILVRFEKDPIKSLYATLESHLKHKIEVSKDKSIIEVIEKIPEFWNKRVILIFDQFEELFTIDYLRKKRNSFVEQISQYINSDKPFIRLVFSIREDFLAELDVFRLSLVNPFQNRYRLLPLTKENAEKAIENPIGSAIGLNYRYESKCLDSILNEITNWEGYVEPSQLQIVCDRLWGERDKINKVITFQSYRRLGGVKDILQYYLQDYLRRTIPLHLYRASEELLKLLVTKRGTRNYVMEDTLREKFSNSKYISDVLERLINERIIQREKRLEDPWIYLTHECLIKAVNNLELVIEKKKIPQKYHLNRVYLCSTIADLKDFRQSASFAIEDAGLELLVFERAKVELIPLEKSSNIFKNMMDECDVFILIVGFRYGYVADEKGKSVLEIEYEYAVRNKKTILVYLIDAKHPTSPHLIDTDKEKIVAFRKRLQNDYPCTIFTTPEDLREKIYHNLRRLPRRPYFAHPYPLQKNFVGRTEERETLTNWLIAEFHPMLSIVASGGMGKTALAWYWLQEDIIGREYQPKGIIWWSFYDKEAGFESFLDHSIEYASGGKVDAKKIESTKDKLDILYTFLSENHFLLVLDGVESLLRAYVGTGSLYQGDDVKEDEKKDYKTCVDPNCRTFLQMLASVPKTKTLITTRIGPKELDDLEGVLTMELRQLSLEDAVEFFYRQGVKGTRAEIIEACKSYGCHPLSLRLLSGMITHDPEHPGDIREWVRYYSKLKDIGVYNSLDIAYNSLDKRKQEFISRLSALRNPMDYDSILIFNVFGNEEKLNNVLIELVDRGMLFRDEKSNKFDLHPIVRRYCYDRLRDKECVHSKLRDYFAEIPTPEKIVYIEDLAPVIELYHHTVRAERYDDAVNLFYNRLHDELYYKFGAYQTIIELLRALFPDGEDKPPRFEDVSAQAWTLNALANSYSLSGQSKGALVLLEMSIEIDEKRMNKKSVAIGLLNLADDQIRIGELDVAEADLTRSIEISREIRDEFAETVGHQGLGRLLAYRGKFKESKKNLANAIKFAQKLREKQKEGLSHSYCSFRALLMSNADETLNYAKKSRELADVGHYERDIIWAEYLIGAAYLMKGNLVEAEKHLTEALTRDRKINLVELEPDILLEFAKLRLKQNHKKEALKHAEEALLIADRCEYRLKQADMHNFLAEFYLAAGDLEKAREHAEMAKERAECGYKVAWETAEKMLNDIM